ncbi:MAG TPA: hypothetical protein VHB99_01290, partial [Pirellulales bacterium]|nr:hypothetical protein [Pirellulales bacterium]
QSLEVCKILRMEVCNILRGGRRRQTRRQRQKHRDSCGSHNILLQQGFSGIAATFYPGQAYRTFVRHLASAADYVPNRGSVRPLQAAQARAPAKRKNALVYFAPESQVDRRQQKQIQQRRSRQAGYQDIWDFIVQTLESREP